MQIANQICRSDSILMEENAAAFTFYAQKNPTKSSIWFFYSLLFYVDRQGTHWNATHLKASQGHLLSLTVSSLWEEAKNLSTLRLSLSWEKAKLGGKKRNQTKKKEWRRGNFLFLHLCGAWNSRKILWQAGKEVRMFLGPHLCNLQCMLPSPTPR